MKLCVYRSHKARVFLEEVQLGEVTDLWQEFNTRSAPEAAQLCRAVRQPWSGPWEKDGEGGQDPPAQLLQPVSGTPWRCSPTQTDLQTLLLTGLAEGWLTSGVRSWMPATMFLRFLPFFFLCSHSGLQAERQVKLAWGHPAMSCNQRREGASLVLHHIFQFLLPTRDSQSLVTTLKKWKCFLHLSPLLPPALRWASKFSHCVSWAIKDERMQKLKKTQPVDGTFFFPRHGHIRQVRKALFWK